MTKASAARNARRKDRRRIMGMSPYEARKELAEWAARGGIKIADDVEAKFELVHAKQLGMCVYELQQAGRENAAAGFVLQEPQEGGGEGPAGAMVRVRLAPDGNLVVADAASEVAVAHWKGRHASTPMSAFK